MARKSRKNLQENQTPVVPDITTEFRKKIPTAAYARLSVEKEDDDSIQTQLTMLKHYIEQTADLELTDIYVDNGYTGTNFERPDFIRMMDDVRHGKIQCVVVKDLSRFGRDFLETGYYIETIFPRLNVRFISINDNFDSFREGDIENIEVPIKNMVNEMYAKDFSRKVTAYNDLHRARGDVKLLRSVYGYKRDVENNIYIVNPDTAPIVQLIFRWYLLGIGSSKIAERLNAMNVLTPLAYKAIVEKGEEFTQDDKWNSSRVRDILRRSIYIGDLVWGRRRKTLFRGIPEHKTPREEWVVWHDMHEPIISKADYEEVQKMLEDKNYRKKSEGKYEEFTKVKDFFQGKVYCMECQKKMRYMRYCYENRDGGYYYCGCKEVNPSNPEQSVLWKVHADYLRIVVTDQINNLVNWVCDHKKLVLQIQKNLSKEGDATKLQRKRMQLKVKMEQIEERQAALYEDFSQGIIDADDYKLLKERKMAEKEELRNELEVVEEAFLNLKRQIKEFVRLEKRLEEYWGKTEFQEKLVKELVESIHVSQTSGIEIRFKCADVIEQVLTLEEEAKM